MSVSIATSQQNQFEYRDLSWRPSSDCLTLGGHSSAIIIERSGRGDFSSSFAIGKKLVDVTGIEPVTPCLQNSRLDSIRSMH
jgi:hypothetical protein